MAQNIGNIKQEGMLATLKELLVLLLIIFVIRTIGFGLYQVPTGSMETTMLVGERFFADKFTPLFWKIKRGDVIAFNDATYNYSTNPVVKFFEYYVWGPNNITKRVIGVPGDRIRGAIENNKPVLYINGEKIDEPYLNKYPLITVLKGAPTAYRRSNMILQSYDPLVGFDKQPFYRMSERSVFRGPSGAPLLREPGTPLYPEVRAADQETGAALPQQNHWNGTDEFYVELGKNQYWVMGDNRLGSQDSRFFGPIDGVLIHGKILFRILSIDTPEHSTWWTSWLLIDIVVHPIDFWTRVRWNRLFQRVV